MYFSETCQLKPQGEEVKSFYLEKITLAVTKNYKLFYRE